ncbi:MAG: hypothetical protein RR058_07980 [Oscillospiraceae bacterium]
MPLEWRADVTGQMRQKRINGKKLAELTGYSEQYISMILNGHKDTVQAREKIEEALATAGVEGTVVFHE